MNANRRKRLSDIMDRLSLIKEEVDLIKEEEQEAYDNMPDGLQNSERGNQMYDIISDLETFDSDIDQCIFQVESIINL